VTQIAPGFDQFPAAAVEPSALQRAVHYPGIHSLVYSLRYSRVLAELPSNEARVFSIENGVSINSGENHH
jgi:hypothetical protein